jgi:hypothetical protein
MDFYNPIYFYDIIMFCMSLMQTVEISHLKMFEELLGPAFIVVEDNGVGRYRKVLESFLHEPKFWQILETIASVEKGTTKMTNELENTLNEYHHFYDFYVMWKDNIKNKGVKTLNTLCLEQLSEDQCVEGAFINRFRCHHAIIHDDATGPNSLEVDDPPTFTIYGDGKAKMNEAIKDYLTERLISALGQKADHGYLEYDSLVYRASKTLMQTIKLPLEYAFLADFIEKHPSETWNYFALMSDFPLVEVLMNNFDSKRLDRAFEVIKENSFDKLSLVRFMHYQPITDVAQTIGDWIRKIELVGIEENPGPTWMLAANELHKGSRKRARNMESEIKGIERRIGALKWRIIRIKDEDMELDYNIKLLAWKQALQKLLLEAPMYTEDVKVPVQILEPVANPTHVEALLVPTPATGQVKADEIVTGNTILAQVEEGEKATTEEMGVALSSMEISDHPRMFGEMTDRKILVYTTTISITTPRGPLHMIHLPLDMLAIETDSPNALPYKQHDLVVPKEMTCVIMASVSKQQRVGIRCSAFPHFIERDNQSSLLNPCSLSQMPNIFLNGSHSNIGELKVQFSSYQNSLVTVDSNQVLPLYFATLILSIVNPLTVATGSTTEFTLDVFIDIETIMFVQRNFRENIEPLVYKNAIRLMRAECQIFKQVGIGALTGAIKGAINGATGIISKTAEGKLTGIIGGFMNGKDNDYPQLMNDNSVFRKGTQSQCKGIGEYSGHVFRLNPAATAVDVGDGSGVTTYNSIAAVRARIATFTINTMMGKGTLVFETSTTPCALFPITTTIVDGNGVVNWAPMDHVADGFCMFSGDICYEFEAIVNGFDAFVLRAVYNPMQPFGDYEISNTLDYKLLEVGPDMNPQITNSVQAPYKFNLGALPLRTFEDGTRLDLGVLSVFIERQLQTNSSSATVEINVYKYAAPNAEWSVPKELSTIPLIASLPDPPQEPPGEIDPDDPPPPQLPPFFGSMEVTWNGIPGGPGGLFTFSVTAMEGTRVIGIIQMNSDIVVSTSVGQIQVDYHNEFGRVGIFNPIPRVFFRSHLAVDVFSPVYSTGSHPDLIGPPLPAIGGINFNGLRIWFANGANINTLSLEVVTATAELQGIPPNDSRLVRRGETGVVSKPKSETLPLLSGEVFSLMDVLKRFSYFSSANIRTTVNYVNFDTILRLPVNTGVANYREQARIEQIQNKIVQISDAFRYFRGGLRYRLIFNVLSGDKSGLIMVKHQPMVTPSYDRSQQRTNGHTDRVIDVATETFPLSQNQVYDIEVPYYAPFHRILNSSYLNTALPTTNLASALGELEISYMGPPVVMEVLVYRALGDDAEFQQFVGFPERTSITAPVRTPIIKPGRQPVTETAILMNEVVSRGAIKNFRTKQQVQLALIQGGVEENPGPGLFSTLNATADNARITIDKFDQIADSILGFINMLGKESTVTDKVYSILLSLSQALLSKQIMVTMLALAQILATLNIINGSTVVKFAKSAFAYIQRLLHIPNQINRDDMRCSDETFFFSTMINGVATMLDYQAPKGQERGWAGKFSSIFLKAANSQNRVVSFIQSVIYCVKKLLYWIGIVKDPAVESQFNQKNVINKLKLWTLLAGQITNPIMRQAVTLETRLQKIVDTLLEDGVHFSTIFEAGSTQENRPVYVDIRTTMKKLYELQEKIAFVAGNVRTKFEPYVLYLCSSGSGTGKSSAIDELSIDCLKAVDYWYPSEPIFTKEYTSEFWNTYVAQPIVKIEEFGDSVETLRSEAAMQDLKSLKGPGLVPANMAHLEDKNTFLKPTIIALTSNVSHPKDGRFLTNTPILRRRDFVVEVRVNPKLEPCSDHKKRGKFVPGCNSCKRESQALIAVHGYSQFRRMDPMEEDSVRGTVYGDTWTNLASLREVLLEDFKEYFTSEMRRYEERKARSRDILADGKGNGPDLYTPAVIEKKGNIYRLEHAYGRIIMPDIGQQLIDEIDEGPIHNIREYTTGNRQVPLFQIGVDNEELVSEHVIFDRTTYQHNVVETAEDIGMFMSPELSEEERVKLEKARGIMQIDDMLTPHNNEDQRKYGFSMAINILFAAFYMIFFGIQEVTRYTRNVFRGCKVGKATFKSLGQRFVIGAKCPHSVCNKTTYIGLNGKLEQAFDEGYVLRYSPSPCEVGDIYEFSHGCDKQYYVVGNFECFFRTEAGGQYLRHSPDMSQIRKSPEIKKFLGSEINNLERFAIFAHHIAIPENPFLKTTITILGLILLFFSIKQIMAIFNSDEEDEAEPQGGGLGEYDPSDQNKKSTSKKKVKQHQRSRPKTDLVPAQNVPTDDGAMTKIQNNVFWIQNESINNYFESIKSVPVHALGGRSFLINKHSWAVIREGCDSEISMVNRKGKKLTIIQNKVTVTEMRPYDYVVVTAKNIESQPSIIKFFVRSTVTNIPQKTMHMYEFRRDGNMVITQLDISPASINLENDCQLYGYSYNREAKGMCGSLIIDTATQKIWGVHNAGLNGKGYCHRLDYEDFVGISDYDDTYKHSVKNGEEWIECGGKMQSLSEVVNVIQKMDRQVYYPLKTSIYPSVANKMFQPLKFPPIYVNKTDKVKGMTAILNGLRKRSTIVKPFGPKMSVVHAYMVNKYLAKCKPVSLPVIQTLTFQDVIFGNELPYHVPLDLSTSAGYPHSLDPGAQGKKHLIKFEEGERRQLRYIKRELYDEIQDILHRALHGLEKKEPYMVSIKDERMVPDKMDKPRIIDGCPIQLTIPLNQYTRTFAAAFQMNREALGHSVGIDRYSIEWSNLAWRFLETSDSGLSIDFRSLGPTLEGELVEMVHELICNWYEHHGATPDETKIRRNLLKHNEHCEEVVWNYKFKNINGSPSGSPLTVLVNSICVQYMMAYCWLELVGDLSIYDQIFSNVYGDDFIVAIPEEYQDQFNGLTISALLQQHNIAITVADHKEKIQKLQKFEEISYLKSFFEPHRTRRPLFIPKFPRDIIEDALCWTKNKETDLQKIGMNAILEMAYGLGPIEHQEIAKKCQQAWLNKGEQFVYRTWNELDEFLYGGNNKVGLVSVSGNSPPTLIKGDMDDPFILSAS